MPKRSRMAAAFVPGRARQVRSKSRMSRLRSESSIKILILHGEPCQVKDHGARQGPRIRLASPPHSPQAPGAMASAPSARPRSGPPARGVAEAEMGY